MNDTRPLPAGDGPADPSSADDSGGDAIERNLSTQLTKVLAIQRDAKAAHAARVEQLNAEAERYFATLDTEATFLAEAIRERQRSRQEAHEQASRDAEEVAQLTRWPDLA